MPENYLGLRSKETNSQDFASRVNQDEATSIGTSASPRSCGIGESRMAKQMQEENQVAEAKQAESQPVAINETRGSSSAAYQALVVIACTSIDL